jgi:hypothetical protein
MAKEPNTVSEHIIALYGHIKGLKREIFSIKRNHLEHMHKDIDKLHDKMDRFLYWLLGGLGAIVITLLTVTL